MQSKHNSGTSTPANLPTTRATQHSASNLTLKSLAVCMMFGMAALLPAYAEHVHQLYYNNSQWVDQDLTALTGGGIAAPYGAIAAFYTTPNQQLHVYYVDVNLNHVHQLYYNNTNWSDSDLTAITGGPAASVYGISAYNIGNLQYIFYTGSDSHIHEIIYNNYDWTDQDITALAGSTSASGGFVLAFTTKPGNLPHVYYQPTQNLDLHQLFFNGTSWSDADLTSIAGAYCYTDWIAGFAVQNTQHILCPGYGSTGNLDMLHIYYNNYSWVYEDISAKVGGAPLNLGSGVAGFRVPGTSQGEVFGVTDDTHVHQYRFNEKWSDLDLTNLGGAPTDAAYGGIAAFPTTPNNQFHVYYQPTTDVYQLYFNGVYWSSEDLTGGGVQASDNSGMAGFAIGNLQHVFYLSYGN